MTMYTSKVKIHKVPAGTEFNIIDSSGFGEYKEIILAAVPPYSLWIGVYLGEHLEALFEEKK